MAQAMTLNNPAALTLSTTLTQLTGISQAEWLSIDQADGDVWVATEGTDGGAVPANAYKVTTGQVPRSIPSKRYGFLGIAAVSGSVNCIVVGELT